jgi:hypothetical protein
MKLRKVVMLAVVVLVAAVPASFAGGIITNGNGLYLGVNDQGHLNFSGDPAAVNAGSGGAIGIAYTFPDGSIRDATSPGCLCEGWGVAATDGAAVQHLGGADVSVGGVQNLALVSFATDYVSGTAGSFATSTTTLGDLTDLQVSQDYHVSKDNQLFEDIVTITNTGATTLTDIQYRRVMDWDVPPTEFNEYVTIKGAGTTTDLLLSGDNGFLDPRPGILTGSENGRDISGGLCDGGVNKTDFDHCGVLDHGAVFDFGFGSLGAGESVTFKIYYGAAADKSSIIASLANVGVELYSLGESSGPSEAGPSPVYAFGFSGVGGVPVATPEPATYGMLGTGLIALFALRRKLRS